MPNRQTSKFRKRSGTVVGFDPDKIRRVIQMALTADGKEDESLATSFTAQVVERLESEGQEMQSSEHVQDLVELVLIDNGYSGTAKSLIIHRYENRKIKDEKKTLLNIQTLDPVSKKFGLNSLRVLASRCLMKNPNGDVIETPAQCLERVATGVGLADMLYSQDTFDVDGGHEQDVTEARAYLKKLDAFDNKFYIGKYYLNKYHFRSLINHYVRLCDGGHMKVSFKGVLTMLAQKKFAHLESTIQRYYDVMEAQDFLPNSPTLMNAGGKLGQLSACFVLDVGDNLGDIMDTASHTAKIFQSGGGVGINYSKIRQEGEMVASTFGVASGPVSFMNIINTVTEVVKQGGKRRGANMGIMEVWHPDIEKFITKKTEPGELENFNVSVGIWEDLWEALKNGDEYYMLRDPRDQQVAGRINLHHLMDIISHSAWKSGEPGLLFFDRVNQYNVFAKARGGPLRTTNPCVTGDTLVSTRDGLQRIESLWESQKDIEVAVDGRMGGKTFRRAPKVIASGIKDVWRLVTREGYEVRLTRDHRVMTDRGWVAASDLDGGDMIHIMNRKGGFGDAGSYEIGMILGWLVGDGTLKTERVVLPFFGEKKELAPKFAQMMEMVVPAGVGKKKYYSISVCEIKGRDEVRVSSARFLKIAAQYGLRSGHKNLVPEQVFQGTEGMQKGFLRALFSADGHINKSGGMTVRLTSISHGMLVDVQRLLLNFGIASRIYKDRRQAGTRNLPNGKGGLSQYHCKACHDLAISKDNVCRFATEIGFLTRKKQDRLLADLGAYTNGPKKEGFVTRFQELVHEGEEQVFDIVEPETHSFIGNSYVMHNCGEQNLYPYESCNLGSINVSNMTKDGKFDWERYEALIRMCARFLDCIIDVNEYPIPEIETASIESRRTGLGVMGVADLLFKLGIPYNSKRGYELQDRLAEAISYFSMDESVEIAKERGPFPLCSKSEYPDGKIPISGYYEKTGHRHDWNGLIERIKEHGIRNVLTTTVAPTGSLGMIAECSNGMEPVFAIAYEKHVAVGQFVYTNDFVKKTLKSEGRYTSELAQKIADNGGSLRGIAKIPAKYRNLFVTAMDLHWADHIMAQATWQNWIGNAISKTINMPHDASPDDVKSAYVLAHELGVKGITVYRDGSRHAQVMHKPGDESCSVPTMAPSKYVVEYAKSNIKTKYVQEQLNGFAGAVTRKVLKADVRPPAAKEERDLCPTCNSSLTFSEGCGMCVECGYSACSSG